MNQILVLSVAAFVIFATYKLFGNQMYLILAVFAVLYLVFGENLSSFGQGVATTDVAILLKADTRLTNILEIDLKKSLDAWTFKIIVEKVNRFLKFYINFFRRQGNKQDLQLLIDTRREILNELSHLVVAGDVKLGPNVIEDFANCTWKYVHAIGAKYDISVDEPLAANAFEGQDLY
jgi:hypothetical protein